MVKQLADVIARILKLAITDPQKARVELDAAGKEALQMELAPLGFVDVKTCAQLLGRPDKVLLYASIVEAHAELDLLEAAHHRARGKFLHALELAHQADVMSPGGDDARAAIERLRDRLDSLME